MKTRLATAAGAAVLTAATVLGAPAAGAQTAAYPTTPITGVSYGASYVSGTLTWYNRSVGVDGALRAVGCRRAWVGTYDASGSLLGARSTSTKCDVTYSLDDFPSVPADVPGGAAYVVVCLDDASASPLDCEPFYRP
ncbi:putative secreted protein [Streptomyces davaonensis JCM 4913]|uniref:Putative secreted protein n=1 Tax=Streptomyces davaonensis (strain DSM 101723 / JCM 4913 / KCC S-0913 / 768) TaxID=1214101 RepID=K4QV46_STRDJ|nr:hypothetical protein [Streptomyces davaonensis]CCK24695.1 putative secreted protein [Streptomyces davaonensis JCM 4913]